jgi:hypothetical protein
MGRIVSVENFARALRQGNNISDVIVDSGGGENVTSEHYADAGDDSFPLTTDFAVTVGIQRSGGRVVVGYADVINTPKALSGDKRIYSRDGTGTAIADVWLKSDGSINLTNANGSIVLLANGSVNINGAIIDASGNITSPGTVSAPNIVGSGSVQASGKELVNHLHLAGTPPGNTGPNL